MNDNRYRLAWLSARRRALMAAKAFYAEASAARDLEAAVAEMQPAPHNTTHPVGRRGATGIHHADDCPMRNSGATGCVCGREGEREPVPIASRERVAEVLREAMSFEPHAVGWLAKHQANRAAHRLFEAGVFREVAQVKAEALADAVEMLDAKAAPLRSTSAHKNGLEYAATLVYRMLPSDQRSGGEPS